MLDLSHYATLWAKALAYLRCGKLDAASRWAQLLVDALRADGLEIR